MKCPIDGTQLVMTDRSGVEIDYCPQCRGVWLDRGELDKIIERSGTAYAPPPPPPQGAYAQTASQASRPEAPRHQKRRENPVTELLGDLFDF